MYQGGGGGGGGGGGLEVVSLGKHLFALPLPPAPTTHSNFKSNMTGWINNGKLVRFASTNKTPALQAITTLLSMNLPHHLSSKVDINLILLYLTCCGFVNFY